MEYVAKRGAHACGARGSVRQAGRKTFFFFLRAGLSSVSGVKRTRAASEVSWMSFNTEQPRVYMGSRRCWVQRQAQCLVLINWMRMPCVLPLVAPATTAFVAGVFPAAGEVACGKPHHACNLFRSLAVDRGWSDDDSVLTTVRCRFIRHTLVPGVENGVCLFWKNVQRASLTPSVHFWCGDFVLVSRLNPSPKLRHLQLL